MDLEHKSKMLLDLYSSFFFYTWAVWANFDFSFPSVGTIRSAMEGSIANPVSLLGSVPATQEAGAP